jgi:acyl-CoA thioesterase
MDPVARAEATTTSELEFLRLRFASGAADGAFAVDPHLTSPRGFLYGGACLSVSVASLELSLGRSVMWATTQFVRNAPDLGTVRMDVEPLAHGGRFSQAIARGSKDGTGLFSTIAVLAGPAPEDGRPDAAAQLSVMPDVRPPDQVHPYVRQFHGHANWALDESYWEVIDLRGPITSVSDADPSRVVLWARVPGLAATTPVMLAYIADIVPMALRVAAGIGGLSMDNTIRYVHEARSEWVLLDAHVHGAARGMGTGTVNCYAEDGTLVAVASQSVRLMEFRGAPPATSGDQAPASRQ